MSTSEENSSKVPMLEVVLIANGVEVARSTDKQIWLNAMSAMTDAAAPRPSPSQEKADDVGDKEAVVPPEPGPIESGDSVEQFASELGVSKEQLVAAVYPTESDPYIQLDAKYWEAFKRTSGYGRIAPVVLVATLLLLWDRYIKAMGELGTRDCAKVFSAIGLNDKNPTRSIRNCDWLQLRGKHVMLNPSMISRAEEVAATYCAARG